jgi:predicted enzyme related to lactoylglutathione lyase
LNSNDLPRARSSYCALFGWIVTGELDLGAHGVHTTFAWQESGPNVGSMGDITGRPGVHPHWLFQFRVASLEPAIATVRNAGGLVLDPIVLPNGERVAVCDDPQGAAFSLRARQ